MQICYHIFVSTNSNLLLHFILSFYALKSLCSTSRFYLQDTGSKLLPCGEAVTKYADAGSALRRLCNGLRLPAVFIRCADSPHPSVAMRLPPSPPGGRHTFSPLRTIDFYTSNIITSSSSPEQGSQWGRPTALGSPFFMKLHQ